MSDAQQQVSDLLQQWSELATEQALTHDTSRAKLRASNLVASTLAVGMAVIAGAGNISTFNDVLQDKKLLAFGALGIMSGVVVALQRYLGLPEKQQAHAHAADEFSQLATDIQAHQAETSSSPMRAFEFTRDDVPADVTRFRSRFERLLAVAPASAVAVTLTPDKPPAAGEP
jgi:hypothetical protein